MRMDIHVHNNVPNTTDDSSRLEAFMWIAVSLNSSNYHTFGCPAYMLTTEAEQGRAKKWEGHSVQGIYMGPSTHHAGSVSLVLNLTTGNASPQFHGGQKDVFDTTRYNSSNARAKSNWQKLLVIDHADIINKKDKFNRVALAISKTYSISGVTHAVDLANQARMFDGTSEVL